MALRMFKELLDGPYDGVGSPVLLKPGSICGGLNVRKVARSGGWKARKGCTLQNTTALESGAKVWSLQRYKHPRNADYHFLAQVNGKLYDSTDDPPTGTAGAFGTDISNSLTLSAVQGGYADTVGELLVYADGLSGPILWGGDNPFCTGFVVSDTAEETDYTRSVTDNRTDTYAVLAEVAADDEYYVCAPQIANGLKLTFGATVNAVASVLTIYAWRAGAWATVGAVTDGTLDTATSTKTHAKDGTVTWTAGADTMRVIRGIMGYWYKVTWSVSMTAAVKITKAQVVCPVARMTNKWSGVYELPLSVRFYDQSATEYVDYSGKLLNESTSQYLQLEAATTSDFIYLKTKEPATGFGFGVVDGYEQTGNAQIDNIDYWNGSAWTTISTGITDETLDGAADSSFAQTGTVWFNAAAITPQKRTQVWDSLPGYWYRVSWDATLVGTSSDCRVFYVAYAPFPEALGAYDGVVEFKGRAFLWGDPEYPNRLRFSSKDRPDCFSGSDSGYTQEFGDMKKIKRAIRFYNELLVFKEDSVWLMEGYNAETFGITRITDTVGTVSGKTVCVTEAGNPGMHQDEVMSVALWADADGVYALDGRKPKKISLPVDQYFNPEHSTAIAATNLASFQAFLDPINNEYHLLTNTTVELVYNYILGEWYPPWERRIGDAADILTCGITLRGSDNRWYTYAGVDNGFIARLENDTSDKTLANVDVIISHTIKTRAICPEQKVSTTLEFTFRKAWIEAKARSSGTIVTKFYKDLATTGTAITAPAAISLVNSGYGLAVDGVDTNQIRCRAFQLEFLAETLDFELELWSFLYTLEVIGELRQ